MAILGVLGFAGYRGIYVRVAEFLGFCINRYRYVRRDRAEKCGSYVGGDPNLRGLHRRFGDGRNVH